MNTECAGIGCRRLLLIITQPPQPPAPHRTFYQSTSLQLWFDGWTTSTPLGYAVALAGLALLGAANEGVAATRAAAARAAAKGCCPCGSGRQGEEQPLLAAGAPPRPCCAGRVSPGARLLSAAASPAGAAATYALHAVVSYLLMLAVMTYNVGAGLAVVGGLAAGHAAARVGGGLADACCAPVEASGTPALP